MKLTPVPVFSYKHPPISFLGCIQRKAPNFRINNRQKFNTAKYHFFSFFAPVYAHPRNEISQLCKNLSQGVKKKMNKKDSF